MGYSHYWNYTGDTKTKAFSNKMKKLNKLVDIIVKNSNVSICYEFNYPHVPYQNSIYGVRFNGIRNEHNETFMFTLYTTEGTCKTNRLPYDIVVCATLFAMEHVFSKKEFYWSSDGNSEDLKDGYNLFKSALK